jgi:murein DD-endopeptidase MepM/ murein hydrolase activator NlpD
VLAVADAVVVKVIDGVAQNQPPNIAPGVAFDPEQALGNSVVLALPGHLFATYAHMQPGSLKVKSGDRVRRGQVLGLIGNSGNATGPHLHFHLATGPGLSGEGVPYEIDAFDRLGAENVDGDTPVWDPKLASSSTARGELPAEHDVVAFR